MTRYLLPLLLLCGVANAADTYRVTIPGVGTFNVEVEKTTPTPDPEPDPTPDPPPVPLPTLVEVGPGKPITELSAIDWRAIQPGTTVKVVYRPEPYVAKFPLTQSNFTLEAVKGPNGERPIIDGANAVARPDAPYIFAGHEARGIICVTGTPKPKGITIRGFEFKGCYESDTYTARDGTVTNYISNAACVYVERGDDVLLEDCEIHHGCHGYFVSTGAGNEQVTSRNFIARNCHIHHCGNATGTADEQVYVEAYGHTAENVRIDNGRNTSTTGLHDRSSNLRLLNCTIHATAMAVLLNSPSEADALTIDDPKFHDIEVDGCDFKSTGNIGNIMAVRSEAGTRLGRRNITIRNTTLRRVANKATKWHTVVCGLSYIEQTLRYEGCLFKTEPETPGQQSTRLWLGGGGNYAGNIVIGDGNREEHNAVTSDMGTTVLADTDTFITPPDWRQRIPVAIDTEAPR